MGTKSHRDPQSEPSAGGQWMALSSDGYVRVSLSNFAKIPLDHLLSGLDDDLMNAAPHAAQVAVISGYTEWLSRTKPAVTLGWDWQLKGVNGHAACHRSGLPRSNIMLIGDFNEDLGDERTAHLLASAVDCLAWQELALAAIQRKYS
jgi:hypothetical protein